MSCWHILGIAPNSDLKTVKRAYAAKLKVTKPDEDPEGFQRLHAAYKQATQLARRQSADAAPPVIVLDNSTADELAPIEKTDTTDPGLEQVRDEDGFEFELDEPSTPASEVKTLTESEIYQQELEQIAQSDLQQAQLFLHQQWEELTSRVNSITQDIKALNSVDSWYFLDQRQALLDLEFKSEFSSYVFKALTNGLNEMKKPNLDNEVFTYLDSIFLWSDRSDLLEQEFGHEAVENLIQAVTAVSETTIKWTSPKQHQGEMIAGNYFARIVATLLDWILLGMIAVLISKIGWSLSGKPDRSLDFILGTLWFLIIAPAMEATPLQGTPGKILFGMKVVNRKGRRLNILHALWRSMMFFLNLVGFKLTVWINFFMKNNRLLHDRASWSMVIKR